MACPVQQRKVNDSIKLLGIVWLHPHYDTPLAPLGFREARRSIQKCETVLGEQSL
jgi:hypothetical protein